MVSVAAFTLFLTVLLPSVTPVVKSSVVTPWIEVPVVKVLVSAHVRPAPKIKL